MAKRLLTLGIVVLFVCCNMSFITLSEENFGNLSGYITDLEGYPISGAKVTITCGDFAFECLTDHNGYYYQDNIPLLYCIWNIAVFKMGYKFAYADIPIGENTKYDFVLLPASTIYVDDDNTQGPWDGTVENPFQYIKDAIDNASDGDTVFVYSGMYNQGHINITKSIQLIGESKDDTILANDNVSIVLLNASNSQISNFTFIGYIMGCEPFSTDEINIYNIEISNNKIISPIGLLIFNCINVEIKGNIFSPYDGDGYIGIFSASNSNVKIENNEISGFDNGMWVLDGNTVKNNLFRDNGIGISAWLYSTSSYPCIISKNNFIQNKIQADFNIFYSSKLLKYLPSNLENNLINELSFKNLQSIKNKILSKHIIWNENYWDDWIGFGPKLISGRIVMLVFTLPWISFDWHPAKEPYDINILNN